MIAPLRTQPPQTLGRQHQELFLHMLPQIRSQARLAFRRLHPDEREELMAEVIANSLCAFARLVQRGKADIAYARPLADFAIRQVIGGRRVGAKCSSLDMMSPCARSAHGITVQRLDAFDEARGEWRAALIEDRRATPADLAAARIDLADWFRSLSRGRRRIAKALAMGESTHEAARQFGLSAARVSQIRRLLKESWERFQNGGCPCVI